MKKRLILTTWTLAIGACAAIVKLTSIGPVVFVISLDRGMGVHTGDSLILIPLTAAAAATFFILKRLAA